MVFVGLISTPSVDGEVGNWLQIPGGLWPHTLAWYSHTGQIILLLIQIIPIYVHYNGWHSQRYPGCVTNHFQKAKYLVW